ncbi:hypothetical protein ACIBCS_14485 [Streptomyces phaeochromogenes]|uniref:hypothetical protein n=1 Tax=Streptomyces phaeochromogenes TaxID=1923 RepID=UPI0033EDBF16
MPENTHRMVTDVPHAKVRAVTERVVQELTLAADKVAAHYAEPAKYPLPADRTAAEHLVARRFDSLTDERKKKAAATVLADLKTGAVRTRRLGDLARVDLRSPASVDTQVKRLGFPERLRFPADELRKPPTSLLPEESAAQGLAAVPAALHKLELRIHRVKCLDETSEWGSDEIHLAGTSVDESGDTLKIGQFKVRSFDDGDVKVYDPPRRFHWFGLDEGTRYPKSYFVTLVLAEVDWGGLADYVGALLDLIKKKVTAYLAAAIGGAIGASGGPVGILIGMAVGAAVGWVFDQLKGLFGDEVFKPVTVNAVIPSLTGRWAGRPFTAPAVADYRGHGGHYQLTYDWRMYA